MKQKAFFAVIIGAILAGLSGIFIKNTDLPPTQYAFFRTLVPCVLMGVWMLSTSVGFFRGNFRIMLLGSAFNAARMYFFFTAYMLTSIGNAVLIQYTWPIFTTILSAVLLKEVISRRNAWLLFFSFMGIVLVYINKPFSFENDDFLGMSASLISAALYSCSVIIFKKEADNYTRNEILFYQNLVSAVAFMPFVFFLNHVPSVQDISISLSHGFFLGTIAFSFFFFGLKHLPASTTASLTYIEVLSALLVGVLWMEEAITWNMLLGGAVILVSTGLLKK